MPMYTTRLSDLNLIPFPLYIDAVIFSIGSQKSQNRFRAFPDLGGKKDSKQHSTPTARVYPLLKRPGHAASRIGSLGLPTSVRRAEDIDKSSSKLQNEKSNSGDSETELCNAQAKCENKKDPAASSVAGKESTAMPKLSLSSSSADEESTQVSNLSSDPSGAEEELIPISKPLMSFTDGAAANIMNEPELSDAEEPVSVDSDNSVTVGSNSVALSRDSQSSPDAENAAVV